MEVVSQQEVTVEQLDFLNMIQEKRLPIWVIGGFADDALVHGGLSRFHSDIDAVTYRDKADFLKTELENMGFLIEEVIIPPNTTAYKLRAKKDLLHLDLVLFDFDESSKRFYISLVNPNTNDLFRIYFSENSLSYPTQNLNGIKINTVSPMTLIQSKNIYARIGSNEERDKDLKSQTVLINKFFPGDSPDSDKFKPLITKQ